MLFLLLMPVALRHRLTATADMGLAFCVADHRANQARALGRTPTAKVETYVQPRASYAYDPPPATVGVRWGIQDWQARGRSLDTNAIRLGALMNQLPPGTPARAAFDGWYAVWRDYYARYVGTNASVLARANVSLNYDDFNDELVQQEGQFLALADDYNRSAAGRAAPFVPTASPASTGRDGSGLPWWVWAAGAVAVTGAAYAVYRRYVATGTARDADGDAEGYTGTEGHETEFDGYEMVG